MTVTVLYPEDGQIPDLALEQEVFGPEVRIVRAAAGASKLHRSVTGWAMGAEGDVRKPIRDRPADGGARESLRTIGP